MMVIHAVGFVFFLFDHSTLIMMSLSMIAQTLFYLLISFMSSAIQDSYAGISGALYASRWYWMSIKQRRMMWQLMMVAQQSKALSVGIFAESNLERFTDVSS